MKSHYDTALDNWISSHPGQTVTVYHVPGLFKFAYERAATLEKATKSFKATGIFPLDKNIFSDDDFLPSEVTDQEKQTEGIDLEDENNRFINFDGPETHDPDDPETHDPNDPETHDPDEPLDVGAENPIAGPSKSPKDSNTFDFNTQQRKTGKRR